MNVKMTAAARILFSLIISALFALGCKRPELIAEPATGSGSAPASAHANGAINHFWFNYNGQPTPGRRVWIRIDDETWAELYPNGTVSRYKRAERTRVNGENGTAVKKLEGDVQQTRTVNDGSFEVFIPDQTATNRILFFRHFQKPEWGPWRALAPITPID